MNPTIILLVLLALLALVPPRAHSTSPSVKPPVATAQGGDGTSDPPADEDTP